MNCPKCKATIEPDSFFCKVCGAQISGAAAKSASAPGSAPATAPSNAQAEMVAAVSSRSDINASRDPAQEKEVWQGRPSWRASAGALVLWFVISFAAVILAFKYTNQGDIVRQLVGWASLAVLVVLLVKRGMHVYGEFYRITTQRLFVHHGILSRVTDQMELVRVDDVRLRQGLMDRLMNTGDVDLLGTDKTDQDVVLRSIFGPAEVAEHLRRNVRMARTKGSLFVENV